MFSQLNKWFTKSKNFLILELAFIAGVFLGKFLIFDDYGYSFILLLITCLAVLFFIFKEKTIKIFAVCGIILFLGISYYNWYLKKITPVNIQTNKMIEAEALICDEPDERELKTKLKVKIEKVIDGDENLVGQKILIDAQKYPQYKYGDLLKIEGKIEEPKIYDDFNYKAYLSKDQIFFIIHNTNVELISKHNGSRIYETIFSIKKSSQLKIKQLLPEPMSALLSGLLLGLRRDIPKELIDAFNATGTSHIIAISGLHIAILVMLFQILTKTWPRNLVFIFGLLGLAGYSILTGLRASVIRASILAIAFLFARQIGRKGKITLLLILIAVLMVIQNPFILHNDIGFQLSFLAILGIIYISPILKPLFKKLPKLINEILSATLAAQLATLPIILLNFGRISILSPIVNILVLLVIPIVIPIGLIAVCLSFIHYTTAQCISYSVWLMLKYIIIIVEFFAQIKFSSIQINFSSWQFILIYYILIVTMIIYMYKKIKHET